MEPFHSAPSPLDQTPDLTLASFGWVIYGLGARAISGIVFMIGPLLLIDAARRENDAALDDELGDGGSSGGFLPQLMPTSVPPITITTALVVQCILAPVLATMALALRKISQKAQKLPRIKNNDSPSYRELPT